MGQVPYDQGVAAYYGQIGLAVMTLLITILLQGVAESCHDFWLEKGVILAPNPMDCCTLFLYSLMADVAIRVVQNESEQQ
jgi:hypothetical protein